jgi:hypothetical protein
MTLSLTHRRLSLSLLAAFVCVVAIPAEAGKRRAVQHPGSSAVKISVTATGTVIDNVTGNPINDATVRIGSRTSRTFQDGKFSVSGSGFGSVDVEASRSGYQSKIVTLTTAGEHELVMRLQPTPTVSLRKTDGTVLDVDLESIEFGYPGEFGGYNKAVFETFCKSDGGQVNIDRSQIRRIIGPAVVTTSSPCCPGTEALKVTIELKTGETKEYWFYDSCTASTTHFDVIARVHTTGVIVYTEFKSLAEAIFP